MATSSAINPAPRMRVREVTTNNPIATIPASAKTGTTRTEKTIRFQTGRVSGTP